MLAKWEWEELKSGTNPDCRRHHHLSVNRAHLRYPGYWWQQTLVIQQYLMKRNNSKKLKT
jgi:hypothetical protein